MKAGVLVNARAGAVKRDPHLVERLQRLVPAGHLHMTDAPSDLPAALARLRDADVETVAVVGGDGTSTWTLTSLGRVWPRAELPSVLLLPGGTINTIPGSIGARGAPDRVLEKIVEDGGTFSSRPRSVLRVRAGCEPPRLGLIFGNGIVSRWLARYNARAARSPGAAAVDVARSLGSIAVRGRLARELLGPYEARVEIDGAEAPLDHFTGMAAGAVRHIGLGFRPFLSIPREGCVGRFHWIMADSGGLGFAFELPAARLGYQSRLSGVRHSAARSVRIRLTEPMSYTLDGDLFPATSDLTIDVGPAIRFLTPHAV